MDYTLNQLENQLTLSENCAQTSNPNVPEMSNPNVSKLLSEKQLDKFQKIGKEKSKDSTFILAVTRELYANNLTSVRTKSVCGRNREKEPITPEKLVVLENLFKERLMMCESLDKDSRLKQLNSHINSAFGNISKSLSK